MTRIAIIALLTSFFVASVSAQSVAQLTEKDYVRVAAKADRGFGYAYYLYIPASIKDNKTRKEPFTIFVAPNNTGKVDDDLAVHEDDVVRRMKTSWAVAAALNVAVLMPVFPRPKSDWQVYTHALDRDSMMTEKKEYRRLDLQLVAMIDDAIATAKKDGIKLDKKVLLNGFSASGMFVNRFTFLHPNRVKAAAIGSPGGWPIAPVEKHEDKLLRYPIGIGDLKAVVGRQIDMKALKKVPLFIFIGDKDENDSVPFGDSYDDVDRELIMPLLGKKPIDRWPIAEKLYKQAGLNAEFRAYKGVEHTVTLEMRDDVRAFLKKYIN